MREQSETRAVILGKYIVQEKATVRAAAEWFGVLKSTVHKDISERLEQIQPELYAQAKAVLEQNKQERHIRGGLATKRKYELQRKQREAWQLKKSES
ncbi:MAG: sporulation transcriptional regulator SpoIIID [Ruminococcus sp.]|nr:sporulation transcriptional regulator SpoIIID [Ruminococcus sp.]